MSNLKILDNPFEFEQKHQSLVSDIFVFNGTGKRHHLRLQLSMRAMLWLRDDYPLSFNFMKEEYDGQWICEAEVFSIEPVNHIIRSLPSDILSIK